MCNQGNKLKLIPAQKRKLKIQPSKKTLRIKPGIKFKNILQFPFTSTFPNGYLSYGIDNDDLLRVASGDGIVVASGDTTGTIKSMNWSPDNDLVLSNDVRRIQTWKFDKDAETLQQNLNFTFPSLFGLVIFNIIFDKSGDFYVGHYDGDFDGTEKPLRKYSGTDGTLLWQSFGNLGADARDVGARVAYASGGILYAGFAQDFGSLEKGYIIRIDPSDGSPLWTINLGDERPDWMIGDYDGGVIVAIGNKANVNTVQQYVLYDALKVSKYDKDGNLLWSFNESNMSNIRKLAVDIKGNLYVGGEGSTTADGVVAKYNSDQVQQWVTNLSGGSGIWDMQSDGINFLICGSRSGRLIKIDMSDGSVVYNLDKDPSVNQWIHSVSLHPGNPATLDDWNPI